ncbi:MAG: flagellar basal-body rod protein FlgC [Melioribacteraceae bacterium]|nr:MAG: flagellar basal-body rod protein FlgC [Melioribacteraceae bacterium]
MKVGNNFSGFNISAKGMRVQRKKMNLIAENIANADTVRDSNGDPYRRKYLMVNEIEGLNSNASNTPGKVLRLAGSGETHIQNPFLNSEVKQNEDRLIFNVQEDNSEGEVVYMPDHPDADEEGYVEMSNVNIINEMVEMIAATRSYEANLTAIQSSKQMNKDALEI